MVQFAPVFPTPMYVSLKLLPEPGPKSSAEFVFSIPIFALNRTFLSLVQSLMVNPCIMRCLVRHVKLPTQWTRESMSNKYKIKTKCVQLKIIKKENVRRKWKIYVNARWPIEKRPSFLFYKNRKIQVLFFFFFGWDNRTLMAKTGMSSLTTASLSFELIQPMYAQPLFTHYSINKGTHPK